MKKAGLEITLSCRNLCTKNIYKSDIRYRKEKKKKEIKNEMKRIISAN